MKFALDYKRLHLRLLLGLNFTVFIIRKIVAKKDTELAEVLKPLGKQVKKLLKQYKRANGALTLVEIKSRDGARIKVKA